jgi:hypothetical protein
VTNRRRAGRQFHPGQNVDSTDADRLFDDVLSRAIAEVRDRGTDVYTFAFYHDHESAAVSVCVDTEVSSARSVVGQNLFRTKHFATAVAEGNLRRAALFGANTGRNLSLGDFALVNVARTDLGRVRPDDHFYLAMIRAVRRREREIVALTSDPLRLLFCASSADDEVGYLWTPEPANT